MAVYEKAGLQMMKDADGNKVLIYPITSLDCVEGSEDLLHYGSTQDLTAEEKARARSNIGAAADDKHTSITNIEIDAIIGG